MDRFNIHVTDHGNQIRVDMPVDNHTTRFDASNPFGQAYQAFNVTPQQPARVAVISSTLNPDPRLRPRNDPLLRRTAVQQNAAATQTNSVPNIVPNNVLNNVPTDVLNNVDNSPVTANK
jgi:hypothetical protein